MCPDIVFVEGRHEIYTEYHHRIVEAVESCLPVTAVLSIDEMACRLMGRERPLLAAMELGRKVKARILERVGPMMRSSVGLATNRYLAKIASDMEKPNGLVALPLDILPEALSRLTLRDLPGIGAHTEKRLNEKGITTMNQLLALNCEQAGELWGSVWGERLWHWLQGEDFDMAETDHLKSISHSHVLAPEMRTAEKAWAVAHKLLHKAAMRLRAADLWAPAASASPLALPFRAEKKPRSAVSASPPADGTAKSSSANARTIPPSSPRSAACGPAAPPAMNTTSPTSSACNSTASFPTACTRSTSSTRSTASKAAPACSKPWTSSTTNTASALLPPPPCSPPTKPPPPASPSTAFPTLF